MQVNLTFDLRSDLQRLPFGMNARKAGLPAGIPTRRHGEQPLKGVQKV